MRLDITLGFGEPWTLDVGYAHGLTEGAIGEVNHVRFEMDEDFMADPDAQFYWKSEASSGYGALDDFAVELEEFRDAVRDGRPPRLGRQDAVAQARVLEAIGRAMAAPRVRSTTVRVITSTVPSPPASTRASTRRWSSGTGWHGG